MFDFIDFGIISAFLAKALIPSLTLLTPLVSWGLYEAVKYIRSKTNNEAINNALTRISHTVETVVAGLTQTMAAELRALTEDGKLTKEDGESLKKLAIQAVKDQVPFAVKQIALLGITNLNDFISTKIEQAVLNQKLLLGPVVTGVDWADKP